jgi:hypothetical protein
VIESVPAYGKTVEQKWTNLMNRISSPLIGLFADYRFKQRYWVILRHFLKVALMFTSGVRSLSTFIIFVIVLDGLYLLLLLFGVNPYLSFSNYIYELLMTILTIIFPIVYYNLSFNPIYSWLFPLLIVIFGVVFISSFWFYERIVEHKLIDKSEPSARKCKICCHCECPNICCDCCFHPDALDDASITIQEIDLKDITEIRGQQNPPMGADIVVNAERLRRRSSGIMKAVSDLCTGREVKWLLNGLLFVATTNIAYVGWYFGSSYGIHLERLSVNC